MHMAHVGALETTIVAEDWSGTIEIRSTLDGNVTNSLVERYRDLASEHLGSVETRELSDEFGAADRADHAVAAFPSPWPRETPCGATASPSPATYRLFDEEAEIGHDIAVRLSAGAVGDGREGRHRLHGARRRDVRTRLSTPSDGSADSAGSPSCSTDT